MVSKTAPICLMQFQNFSISSYVKELIKDAFRFLKYHFISKKGLVICLYTTLKTYQSSNRGVELKNDHTECYCDKNDYLKRHQIRL